MFIPTNTYGPTKKVAPRARDMQSLVGYHADDGNDYIGIKVDFEVETWFAKMIEDEGLEALCKKYPYQPLKVDKNTGALVPINGTDYSCRITNVFHAIYHMRLDEYNRKVKEMQQMTQQQPQFAQQAPNTFCTPDPGVAIQPTNYVQNNANQQCQNQGYGLNLASAYHHEPENPQIHEATMHDTMVENQQDIDNKYGFTNQGGMIDPNAAPTNGWHPNMNGNLNPDGYQQQYMMPPPQPNMYPNYGYQQQTMPPMPQPPMAQQSMSPMMPQNPYMYNPAYANSNPIQSFIPCYKGDNPAQQQQQFPVMAGKRFACFADAEARRDAANAAAMARAKAANEYDKMINPSRLETSDYAFALNNIDFSDPESIARVREHQMQRQYVNPMYNNMGNPNIMQQPMMPQQQYGMNNPFAPPQQPPMYNQGFGMGMYNTGYGYNNIITGGGIVTSTDFMEYTEEEMAAGRCPRWKITRTTKKQEEEAEKKRQEEIAKKKKYEEEHPRKMKVTLYRTAVIKKDGKEVEVPLEEYEKIKKEQQEIEDRYNKIIETLQLVHPDFNPADNPQGYTDEYIAEVKKLVLDIDIYDRARAMCVMYSISDGTSKENFNVYFTDTEKQLQTYREQEKMHPELNYRVPFRYRKTPHMEEDPETGTRKWVAYEPDIKRTARVDEYKTIPFYTFDRARDPNQMEWSLFLRQAVSDRRDIIVQHMVEKDLERVKQDQAIEACNEFDPMQYRMKQYLIQQKQSKMQYDFYREAKLTTLTDKQFNDWWYMYTPKANPNGTELSKEARLDNLAAWRYKKTEENIQFLSMLESIDQNAVRNEYLARANAALKPFGYDYLAESQTLMDFFDRLGYVGTKIAEDNIAKQRTEGINKTISETAYRNALYDMVNVNTEDNRPNYNPNAVHQKVDPDSGLPADYIDFTKDKDYPRRRAEFMHYCDTVKGSVELKPIYK